MIRRVASVRSAAVLVFTLTIGLTYLSVKSFAAQKNDGKSTPPSEAATGKTTGAPDVSSERSASIAAAFQSQLVHDIHGKEQRLWVDGKGDLRVVLFMGCECPLAKFYVYRLNTLAKEFAQLDVPLVAIVSNDQDSLVDITNFIRQQKVEFPIYKDLGQQVATAFGAVRTPEAFVVDKAGKIYYRGRIDDSSGIGYRRQVATHNFLQDAVSRATRERLVSSPTEAVGCIIGQRNRNAPQGDITFSRHVAKIFYRSCVECHRAGQLAPFSLVEYDNAASWAMMIAEVVEERRMPPWFANPQYGHFLNDTRLSDADRQTILTWVKNGSPQGDPSETPTPPSFAENWRIDEPDLVVHMREEPFDVPAEGPISYQMFVAPTNEKQDRWIQQAEVRPGNPEVVHHCSLWVIPPGTSPQVFDAQPVFAYAPGSEPVRLPADAAVRMPAGSSLLFQLHYEPNGRPAKDRSYVGLKYVDPDKVRRPVVMDAVWPDDPLRVPAKSIPMR